MSDDPFPVRFLDAAFEDLITRGEIVSLNDDRVVEPSSLIRDSWFSTRMSVATSKESHLPTGLDLAAFAFDHEYRASTGKMVLGQPVVQQERGYFFGSPGWSPELNEPSVVAFRFRNRMDLDVNVLASDARTATANEARIVAAMREAYDRNFDGAAMEANVLVYDALLSDPSLFREPVRPLSEVLADGGLLTNGEYVFHHEHVWRYHQQMQRAIGATVRAFELDESAIRPCVRLLAAVDRIDGQNVVLRNDADADLLLSELTSSTAVYELQPPVSLKELAELIPALLDPDVFSVFSAEFLGVDSSTSAYSAEAREAFIHQALEATNDMKRKSLEDRKVLRCLLWLLGSMNFERELDFVAAEDALRKARVEHDGMIEPIRRLAWYHLERDDSRNALTLLHVIHHGASPDSQLDRHVRQIRFHTAAASPKVGRNDKC